VRSSTTPQTRPKTVPVALAGADDVEEEDDVHALNEINVLNVLKYPRNEDDTDVMVMPQLQHNAANDDPRFSKLWTILRVRSMVRRDPLQHHTARS
jgi:hypothetical protein